MMKKYGTPEQTTVFSGKQAAIVSNHLQKQGKALSDFSKEERAALDEELQSVDEE